MKRAFLLISQLFGAGLSGAASAEVPVPLLQPHNPSISCEKLLPYEHAWSWRTVMPDGSIRPQGIWSDHLDATTQAGRQIWRRVQGMTYLTGASRTDVLLFDRASCAPIMSEQHRLNGVVLKHMFTNGQVTAE